MLFSVGKCVAQENDVLLIGDTIFFQPEITQIEPIEFNLQNGFVPDPRRAVRLAAIAPGLGQIYNRKYWKVPIIYGAFVGLAYGLTWNNTYYRSYRQAYSDFLHYMGGDESANSWVNMLPMGMDPATVNQPWFRSVLSRRKDIYRRNRDLCIIGIVGVYVLSIVDAFVDAQLFGFDISPDLTLNIKPQMQVINGNNTTVGLQCLIRF